MPGREVRGQEQLPGATERLLQATTRRVGAGLPVMTDYLGLSVSRRSDGTLRVTVLRRDPGSGRMVPTWLDTAQEVDHQGMTLVQILAYWAQELRVAELDPWE